MKLNYENSDNSEMLLQGKEIKKKFIKFILEA